MHTDGQARGLVVAALFAALMACVCSLVTAPPAPAKEAGVKSQLQGVQPPADGLELDGEGPVLRFRFHLLS